MYILLDITIFFTFILDKINISSQHKILKNQLKVWTFIYQYFYFLTFQYLSGDPKTRRFCDYAKH